MSTKDPVKYTVNGREYVTIPLTGREGMRLDKLVTPIIFNMSKGAKKLSLSDLAMLMCQKMSEISEDTFEEIRRLSFKGTMFSGSDTEKSFSLDSEQCFEHFAGRLIDMYEVMLESWRAHQLTPFRMMAGPSTEETASSVQSLPKDETLSKK